MSRAPVLILAAFVAAIPLTTPLLADDPPKPVEAKPAEPGPNEFEARFADESTLKVTLLDSTVGITTKYGKLTLPLAEIRRMEIGFRFPPGMEAKVDAVVADLASPVFRTREEAEKALFAFGEYAIPATRRAKKSADTEISRRADNVWKKLQEKLPAEKFDMKDYDVIEADFTVRGKLDPEGLKIKSKYFGEGEMKLSQVRGLRSLAGPNGVASLSMDSGKYARQGWTEWMDTGVDVTTDQPLEVTATGQIDQWSQEPGRYLSSPQGTGAQAPGLPNNKAVLLAGVNPNLGRAYVPSGALIGKVGVDGQPFMIGASYKVPKGPAAGRLYLIIAPSNWGNESIGKYEVKVKSGS